MAEHATVIRSFLIRAEDARLIGDMFVSVSQRSDLNRSIRLFRSGMKRHYLDLTHLNRDLINGYRIRCGNHEELMKHLRYLNQMVQKAGNLRSECCISHLDSVWSFSSFEFQLENTKRSPRINAVQRSKRTMLNCWSNRSKREMFNHPSTRFRWQLFYFFFVKSLWVICNMNSETLGLFLSFVPFSNSRWIPFDRTNVCACLRTWWRRINDRISPKTQVFFFLQLQTTTFEFAALELEEVIDCRTEVTAVLFNSSTCK